MLQKKRVRAVHHGRPLPVLQQDTYHRGLRHKRVHPVADAAKLRSFGRFLQKAGAVMIIDRLDARLHRRTAEGRCIHGQIATLGMAAGAEPARERTGRFIQIGNGLQLGWNSAAGGHIEILLPADQRSIRSAKRRVGQLALRPDADGRKLLLLHGIQKIHEPAQPRALKPTGRRQRSKKALVLCKPVGQFFRLHHRCRFIEPDGAGEGGGDHAVERQIRQPAQDQAVNRVERCGGKRKVAAPSQIIEHICHASTSLSCICLL